MNVYEKLLHVQSELKVPKSNYNSFGKYSYRNCEDILEAFKPLGKDIKAVLTVNDELVLIGERYYVKSVVTFIDIESCEKVTNTAYAREEDNKKGMDSSQVTGATSSYARKYALNGLFCIDDTKDSDCTNNEPKNDNKHPKSNNEKDILVQVFEDEIIRTGKSRKWFLEQAKATEPKYIKADKLKEFVATLKTFPCKEVS